MATRSPDTLEKYLHELLRFREQHQTLQQKAHHYLKAEERQALLEKLLKSLGFDEKERLKRRYWAYRFYSRYLFFKRNRSDEERERKDLLHRAIQLDPLNAQLLESYLEDCDMAKESSLRLRKQYQLSLDPLAPDYETRLYNLSLDPNEERLDYLADSHISPLLQRLLELPDVHVPESSTSTEEIDLLKGGMQESGLDETTRERLKKKVEHLLEEVEKYVFASSNFTWGFDKNPESLKRAEQSLEQALSLAPYHPKGLMLALQLYASIYPKQIWTLESIRDKGKGLSKHHKALRRYIKEQTGAASVRSSDLLEANWQRVEQFKQKHREATQAALESGGSALKVWSGPGEDWRTFHLPFAETGSMQQIKDYQNLLFLRLEQQFTQRDSNGAFQLYTDLKEIYPTQEIAYVELWMDQAVGTAPRFEQEGQGAFSLLSFVVTVMLVVFILASYLGMRTVIAEWGWNRFILSLLISGVVLFFVSFGVSRLWYEQTRGKQQRQARRALLQEV